MKPVFSSSVTKKHYVVVNHNSKPLNCTTRYVIYLITCRKCGVQYVGETSQKLHERVNGHRVAIRAKANTLLSTAF